MPATRLLRRGQTASPNDPAVCRAYGGFRREPCFHRPRTRCASCGHRPGSKSFAIERKADNKGSALVFLGFKVNAAAVFVNDYRACDGQALPGSLADFFGGEERVKEI